jgi:aerobic carbon-monoxide dehydrogenase medium subunit
MVMYPTRYHRPKSLDEALALHSGNEDASYLSGGHTLLPALKQRLARPSDLIDLAVVPGLHGIKLEKSVLSIGATTTHAEVAISPVVRKAIPALAGMVGSIGDRHVRNRGTIGGSVANNDPAADYPSAVLGLGAIIVTDRRRIAADDFFVALYETALEPGEIITRVDFPVPDQAGYAKFRSAASRYAVAAVFVAKFGAAARAAVTGAGSAGVFRLRDLEEALTRDFSPAAVAHCKVDPAMMMEDLAGSSEYRANLVLVMARRALQNLGAARSYK